MNDTSWSIGVLVGVPLTAVSLAVFITAGITLIRWDRSLDAGSIDKGAAKWFGVVSLVVAALVLAVAMSPGGFYPFSGEYHQWRPVSGTVERIDSRLVNASGDSTETKFVIRFDDNRKQYGCDDTRCAGVDAGDELSLSCKRAWQYTGSDGYDCRFVDATSGGTR